MSRKREKLVSFVRVGLKQCDSLLKLDQGQGQGWGLGFWWKGGGGGGAEREERGRELYERKVDFPHDESPRRRIVTVAIDDEISMMPAYCTSMINIIPGEPGFSVSP